MASLGLLATFSLDEESMGPEAVDLSKFREIPKAGTKIIDSFSSEEVVGDLLKGHKMLGGLVQERKDTYVIQAYGPYSGPVRIVVEEGEPMRRVPCDHCGRILEVLGGKRAYCNPTCMERHERVLEVVKEMRNMSPENSYLVRRVAEHWADRLEGITPVEETE